MTSSTISRWIKSQFAPVCCSCVLCKSIMLVFNFHDMFVWVLAEIWDWKTAAFNVLIPSHQSCHPLGDVSAYFRFSFRSIAFLWPSCLCAWRHRCCRLMWCCRSFGRSDGWWWWASWARRNLIWWIVSCLVCVCPCDGRTFVDISSAQSRNPAAAHSALPLLILSCSCVRRSVGRAYNTTSIAGSNSSDSIVSTDNTRSPTERVTRPDSLTSRPPS